MVLPGETLGFGGNSEENSISSCPDCSEKLIPKVMRSNAGYYIGTSCCCGPYSRESGYYKTKQEADVALTSGNIDWRV